MRLRFGKKVSLTLVSLVFAASAGIFLVSSALAATGSIYLTPTNGTVNNGDNITLNLRINPGATVNGVQATVNYDAAKLQYVSVNTAGSAFSAQLQQTQSSGSVAIARGDFSGGISADSLIETITFKALAGSGTSSVTLSGANATDSTTSNYTNPSTSSAVVNFSTPTVTPPPTCPAGQTGTPPNCVTPPVTTPVTPTPPKPTTGTTGTKSAGATTNTSTTQPASVPAGATTVTVTDKKIAFTSALISTTSSAPTQVYIRYGIDGALTLQTPADTFATTHSTSIDPSTLVPGETYSYVIVATNQQGVTSQSAPAEFTTTGLKVAVVVVDKNNKPLANANVTLHSTPVTGKTDGKGAVTFSNVTPGTHHVIYTAGKTSYSKDITVLNNVEGSGTAQTASTQNFSVAYDLTQKSFPMLWVWLGLVLLVVVVLAVLAQSGRLGLAFQMRRTTGDPLVSNPVVVGGSTSAPQPYAQAPVTIKPESELVAEHLKAIPDPVAPQPGNLVAPHPIDVESTNDESGLPK